MSIASTTPAETIPTEVHIQTPGTQRWVRQRALTLAAAGMPLPAAYRFAFKEFHERQLHAGGAPMRHNETRS